MAVPPIPEGLRSVNPHIVCSPCADAIDFYERAFGAEEVVPRMADDDGVVGHAQIRIGDTTIMLADEWPGGPTQAPTTLGGTTAALMLYVDDVDAAWERALAAGAEEVFPLEEQFYGEKGGRVRDPFGHTWGISQQVEVVDDAEMARRMAAFYEE